MVGNMKTMKLQKLIAAAAIITLIFFTCSCGMLKTFSDRRTFDSPAPTSGRSDNSYSPGFIIDQKPGFGLDIESNDDEDEDFVAPEFPDTTESGGLERDENGILIGSMVFDKPVLLMGAFDEINVRTGPATDTPRVATIGLGQLAEATEVVDGWYRITVLPGMFTGYTRSDLLVDYTDTKIYRTEPRIDNIESGSGNDITKTEIKLVDVRTIIPDVKWHMILATPHNFTGKTLYERDIPILQLETAEKLKKANELFTQDGYTIKIYDAYRPSSVSGIMNDIIKDSAEPSGTVMHNKAAAVDMTLVDADGNELEMPSPMYTLDYTSNRDYRGMTPEARKNMDYMTSVMQRCGFTTVSSEWWHFSDGSADKYPPLDLSFTEFKFYLVNG